MVRALLGEHALPYAVVYDQFGTFVLLSTFGLYVLARYGGDVPPTAREMGLRILKFPPVWALLVGLTLMPEQPPAWIGGALQKLADALLPLVMLAVGLTIQLKLPRDEVKPLAVGLLLRLLVMPALALPLSLAFGMSGEMLQANVLESAMPTMITAAALAISHQLAPRLAAALVGYGILLSLATLPMWAWVVGRAWLHSRALARGAPFVRTLKSFPTGVGDAHDNAGVYVAGVDGVGTGSIALSGAGRSAPGGAGSGRIRSAAGRCQPGLARRMARQRRSESAHRRRARHGA